MIPRFKKAPKAINQHLNKEQFLEEHNRLSPKNLRATISLLTRFRVEKASLFKNEDWSIDKLRRPFIFWSTSLPPGEKGLPKVKPESRQGWHSYDEKPKKQELQ
jgi:hypothetical protein